MAVGSHWPFQQWAASCPSGPPRSASSTGYCTAPTPARNIEALTGLDILQSHLATSDKPVPLVGNGRQPKLLFTAAVNRGA